MNDIKLLDCTLRDGGYINDWEFGQDNLICIFERLASSNVDIIEIGFLDERRMFDINRSIMPNTESVQKIYGKVNKKKSMIVGMIDYGTCSIAHVQPCLESFLDGIRVIFKKHMMHEAIAFCAELKYLGYQVFIQAVSITSYSDEELMELIELVNNLKPYTVSMVDTYGILHQDNLLHYFQLFEEHLLSEIGIGYHSHNNFQLAYANCIEFLKRPSKHRILVDGTLYGMGKSAGNAPMELLAMHLNENYGKHYDVNQMIEAIDSNIMKIYQKTQWGYNLFYYLAASNRCHPNYVQYLMNMHTLSIKSINEILETIVFEKKLLYNKEYIEKIYWEYQKKKCDDADSRKKLKLLFKDKEILIIGPGKTVITEKEKINNYIKEKSNLIVVSINFIHPNTLINYVFLSNSRRYIRINNALKEEVNKEIQIIATSNVTEAHGKFTYIINNETLIDEKAEYMDNSFIMLLKLLIDLKPFSIVCAGLDGYSPKEDNYANSDMEYWFAKRKAESLNSYVKEFLKEYEKKVPILFLTKTFYRD